MKKAIFTSLLGLILSLNAAAQLETKGWWTRDLVSYRSYHEAKGGSAGLGRTSGRFVTQPEFGYALNKHCLVGLIVQYSNSFERQTLNASSSGLLRSNDQYLGAGPLFRYFIPLGKRVAFMPELFFTYYGGKKTEVISNFGIETRSTTRYNSIGTGAFPSLVCFLTRDLALSLTVASLQYYGNKDGYSFIAEVNPQQWLLGVEYYFENGKRSAAKEKP